MKFDETRFELYTIKDARSSGMVDYKPICHMLLYRAMCCILPRSLHDSPRQVLDSPQMFQQWRSG